MYSDGELMDIREKYLEENRPEEFERLQCTGELEQYLERSAKACVEQAESFMKQGVMDQQAWRWAIRVTLLDTEPD